MRLFAKISRELVSTTCLCLLPLGAEAALGSQAPQLPVSVPAPEAKITVGTSYLHLRDESRLDPYQQDGSKRELMLRAWYPAARAFKCRAAEYAPSQVWAYLSKLSGLSLPNPRTSSCLDAPVEPGRHPVVLFSHGYTGTFTDSTFLVEDLATRGYIVLSIAHTGETTAVELPSKKLVPGLFGSYLDPESLRFDDKSLHSAREVRFSDLRFVVDQLGRVNRTPGPLTGTLNLSEIGVIGHSLGGEMALVALQRDPRLRVAVVLDAPIDNEDISATSKPVLMLTAARRNWTSQECRLWQNLHGPRLLVNLSWADHYTFSDALWMLGTSSSSDDPDGSSAIQFLRHSIAGFLDQYVKRSSTKPWVYMLGLQTRVSVTTQSQSLCSLNSAQRGEGMQ